MKLRSMGAAALTMMIILSGTYAVGPLSGPMVKGVSIHGLDSKEASLLWKAGVKWVRIDMSTNDTHVLKVAHSHNLSVLGILDAYSVPANFTLNQWNQSVQSLVTNYSQYVSAWEIWNEPCYKTSDSGFYNGSAYHYFLLLKSAYGIIKADEPNSTVIGYGGLSWIGQKEAFQPWFNQLQKYDPSKYMDAASVHIYISTNNPAALAYEATMDIMATRLKVGNNIWVTETGIQDGKYNQSQYIETIFPALHSAGVSHVFWYDLNNSYDQSFGLFNSTGHPKPSYYALKSV